MERAVAKGENENVKKAKKRNKNGKGLGKHDYYEREDKDARLLGGSAMIDEGGGRTFVASSS